LSKKSLKKGKKYLDTGVQVC